MTFIICKCIDKPINFITNTFTFLGGLALYFFTLFLYYATHLEYDPLTGRSQFMLLNDKQKEKLARLTFESVSML